MNNSQTIPTLDQSSARSAHTYLSWALDTAYPLLTPDDIRHPEAFAIRVAEWEQRMSILRDLEGVANQQT